MKRLLFLEIKTKAQALENLESLCSNLLGLGTISQNEFHGNSRTFPRREKVSRVHSLRTLSLVVPDVFGNGK